MRGRHQNGTGSGSALQQQGKSYRQRRGLGARHLLRLLVLLAAQQGFSMGTARFLSRSILQPATVVVGTLLTPQAAQAQCPSFSLPSMSVTVPDPGQLAAIWSTLITGQSDVDRWDLEYRKTGASGWTSVTISDAAARNYTITGLEAGTAYQLRLRARPGGTLTCPPGPFSAITTTTTSGTAGTPVLTAKAGDGQVTLFYYHTGGSIPSNNAWSYKIIGTTVNQTFLSSLGKISGSYTITSLQNGRAYTFQVEYVGQGGIQSSNLVTVTPNPPPPPVLISDPDKSVTAGTGGTVVVCYNLLSVSHDGTTYLEKRTGRTAVPAHSALKDTTNGVSITEAPAVISAQVLGTGNVNFDPCATVAPGTHTVTWEWRGPDGAASKGTTSTTFTVAPHPSTVPAKPTEVRARSLNGGVALFWAVPGDNRITGWKYRRKAADDDNWGAWTRFLQFSTQYSGGSGTHGSTFGGLTNGTVYAFQIRATSANGDGAVSDTVAARPMAAPATVTATVAPAKPAKFRATGGNGQVTLRWADPEDGSITRWEYQQKSGGGTFGSDWTLIDESAYVSDQTITGLTNGTEYTFRVRAVNSIGNGAVSDEVSATPQAKTIALTASSTTIAEGNSGHTDITVTATLSENAPQDFPFYLGWDTEGGTAQAQAGNDCSSPPDIDVCWVSTGTITIASGQRVATRTLRVFGDTRHEDDETTNIYAYINGPRGVGWTTARLILTIVDDDPAPTKTITLSADSTTIDEGDSGRKDVTITVTLSEPAPAGGVSMTFSLDPTSTGKATTSALSTACANPVPADADMCWSQLAGNPALAALVRANTLTLNSGARSGTIKIGILGDTTVENDKTLKLRVRTTTAGWADSNILTLTIRDDDGATAPAAPTNFTATAGNGQVTLNWSDPSDATITRWEYQQKTGGNFGASWTAIPSSGASTTSHEVTGLTNNTAYTFRIRAVSAAGNGAVSDEQSATPVAATPAGVTVSVATLTVDEGSSGAYTMRLNTEPSNTVTITVGGASGDVTVSGSPLTFTTSNYGTAQTVTVNAAEDNDTTNDSATLTHGTTSSDTTYGASLSIQDVSVTVTDNDTPGVTVEPTTLSVNEGSSSTYTVKLNTEPTHNVTVTVGGASGEVSVTGSPLTFTTSNYGTAQTVTVNAGEDEDTANDSATLTHRAASSDSNYGASLSIQDVSVTVTDNDSPAEEEEELPPAPDQATGLTAKVGNAQVTLSWEDPDNATITKWQMQRKEGSGSYGAWVDVPDSGATTTSHTVTGLTNGTVYSFRIRAVNAGGNSPASAEVRATPMAPPLKPTGVTATAGHGQVTLSWDNPDNATISKWQYQQKQGDGSYGPWMDIPDSTASTTSHTVTGLTNGTVYSFRIRAVNAGGNGAPSDEITATPVDLDAVQADKARSQALAATSRTLLGMATDVLGSRTGGDAPVALAGAGGSMGEQAMGVVENLLGIGGSELPTSLTLEEVEDRLWSQSFQLTPPAKGSDGQQGWNPSLLHQRSWALWGAGELRSYRGNDDTEHLSYSGNVKTAWLGIDHQFTDRWMAGAALSFATGQSDYSYRKTDGSKDGGKMESHLTVVYPYGSFQVSEGLRLWGMAGMGWGTQHHQQTGNDAKAEGDLRLQMGVVGFERSLSSIGDLSLSLAGDAGLVKSTTEWKAGSGLWDLSVSLHRIRMGVDGSFPLAEHTTGYVNIKGRIDGGDLPMNAAELVAGVQYSQARFSGFLQGRQVYAFDGSYAESALTAQLRLTANSDGTGLGWTLQPSYGAGTGDVALAAGPSLWTDEQLESLTGAGAAQKEGQHLEWSSRVGYGIHLQSGELLLTPFTEVRFREAGSQHIGLGLTLEGHSWNVEFSGSTEHTTNASPTGNLQLNFSKRL